MACVGAERACVDVDALFSSCWAQDDSLTRLVCSMISAPLLVDFKWSTSSKQGAVEAAPFVVEPVECTVEAPADSVEAPADSVETPADSVEAPADSVEAPADSVEAPADSVEAPADSVEAPANSVETPADSVEAPADSVVAPADSVEAPADSVEAPANSIEAPADSAESAPSSVETSSCSVEVPAWVVAEPEQVLQSFPVAELKNVMDPCLVAEAQQGVKVGAEASSGWSSMSRSESSCSSHSACLIDLAWDSSSSSSSSDNDCCSLAELTGVVPLAADQDCVKRGIGRGISSSGKGWSMEVKGFGKAEKGSTFSNQLFGEDGDDDEEGGEEHGSSRQSYKIHGAGNMCYMNQLWMDEAEEEEREALAASGISVGIGRFGARRRISGSSSRVTLRRMSSVLRQF
ncbi:hypothetical protein CLOM_g16332 [Closterium sp. NIES-68]|nr:hypothetical protein CLOM_g16332 [Closterium sp. NIES-68]GJP68994.1 hypothetical protein CLOP_g25626 [Closterium sp. NIES-67]